VNSSTLIAEKLAYPLAHFLAGFLTDCLFTIILIDKLLFYGTNSFGHKYILIMLSKRIFNEENEKIPKVLVIGAFFLI